MNTPKHTPGPWVVNGDGNVESHFGAVADVCGAGFGCDDETNPNAALIASAPELLQEARHALNVLAAIATGQLESIRKDSPAILGLRSAIAKAEGRR